MLQCIAQVWVNYDYLKKKIYLIYKKNEFLKFSYNLDFYYFYNLILISCSKLIFFISTIIEISRYMSLKKLSLVYNPMKYPPPKKKPQYFCFVFF